MSWLNAIISSPITAVVVSAVGGTAAAILTKPKDWKDPNDKK